ncbi:MAG: ACT domain-containing protein [Saccharofermentanales bacterium]|jgi:hypothetical protein|nr:amino acid-binding protein [Clostridiaceae bacterium]
MLVKQISVFLENKSGSLAKVTRTLCESGIDIRALYIAETTDYGVLRMIVDQPEGAQTALSQKGFTVGETEVIAVAVADRPGTLNAIVEMLGTNEISIEYLYAFVGRASKDAIVIIRVEDPDGVLKLLSKSDFRIMRAQEVYGV